MKGASFGKLFRRDTLTAAAVGQCMLERESVMRKGERAFWLRACRRRIFAMVEFRNKKKEKKFERNFGTFKFKEFSNFELSFPSGAKMLLGG